MKILYAIQGTGNGHVARAREVLPLLETYGDLDILLSGAQSEVNIGRPITYRVHGVGYYFGKKGNINYPKSIVNTKVYTFMKDIMTFPLEKYDLIINDFEPVTAWAAKLRNVPIVGFGHQYAFLSEHSPRPNKKYRIAEAILKKYAPVSSAIGLHFEAYDDFIYTPIIRKEIREQPVQNLGHITMYLPSYDDVFLVRTLLPIKNIPFHIFSKHTKVPYTYGSIKVFPVDAKKFVESMVSSAGIITNAGFETPAEAMYLGKKIMAFPMKGQYEQWCNAASLRCLGVAVNEEINSNFAQEVIQWMEEGRVIQKEYPDQTKQILDRIFQST